MKCNAYELIVLNGPSRNAIFQSFLIGTNKEMKTKQ